MAAFQVVAYDQGNGAYGSAPVGTVALGRPYRGCRLEWRLCRVGSPRGLPISTAVIVRPATHFTPRASALGTLDAEEIERSLAQEQILLIDARGADRFAGENEKIDPVAGHIPGAPQRTLRGQILTRRDAFCRRSVLRSRWQAVLGARPTSELCVDVRLGSDPLATTSLALESRACPARACIRALGANGFAILRIPSSRGPI